MRILIINMICFGAVGAIIATLGGDITSWQLWSILGLMAIVDINRSINE